MNLKLVGSAMVALTLVIVCLSVMPFTAFARSPDQYSSDTGNIVTGDTSGAQLPRAIKYDTSSEGYLDGYFEGFSLGEKDANDNKPKSAEACIENYKTPQDFCQGYYDGYDDGYVLTMADKGVTITPTPVPGTHSYSEGYFNGFDAGKSDKQFKSYGASATCPISEQDYCNGYYAGYKSGYGGI